MVKIPFESHVTGCRPIITKDVLYSAYNAVNGAFRPGRAGRFNATNTARRSTAGYSARTVPRFASSEASRRGLVRCRHRICDHVASRCEASIRLKTAFANEGTPVVLSTVSAKTELTARIRALKDVALRLFNL